MKSNEAILINLDVAIKALPTLLSVSEQGMISLPRKLIGKAGEHIDRIIGMVSVIVIIS